MIEQDLKNIVGERNFLSGQDVLDREEDWGRECPCPAKALVRPGSTEEVSQVLAACYAVGQTVVTHGGRTGLAQGAVSTAEDIILSLERLVGIESVDAQNRTMTVWAGTPLQKVQEAANDIGLHFALDLGARGTATIGGNIATNAGGLSVIRYGMMREQVLGLEAVLADGTVVTSLNNLIKNNSGYDLKQLFIGSEGTLGIVTRATLRLRPAYIDYNTALLAVNNYSDLVTILHSLDHDMAGSLLAFEVMWQSFYQVVTGPKSGCTPPISQDYPYYILIEGAVINRERDQEFFQDLLMGLMERGLIADAVIAKSDTERQSLWNLREDTESIFNLGPMINFDISLPLGHIPEYLSRVEGEIRADWPEAIIIQFGHLGDNNLHLSISIDDTCPEAQKKVKNIIYGSLENYNGAVSAEHGIGLEKIAYLSLCRSETEIALMRCLKRALDPKGILNPEKIIGKET